MVEVPKSTLLIFTCLKRRVPLKEAFTKEFEGILSKSEINKIVMTELNA